MPNFRVDVCQGNRRNIGKFQGRHVVIHCPCIFSACTAVSWNWFSCEVINLASDSALRLQLQKT